MASVRAQLELPLPNDWADSNKLGISPGWRSQPAQSRRLLPLQARARNLRLRFTRIPSQNGEKL